MASEQDTITLKSQVDLLEKIYVLDTNVLLHNPESMFAFEENDVVIPESVIEELDNFKRGKEQINVNARDVARKLYQLKQNSESTLFQGIKTEGGGKIYVHPTDSSITLPITWDDKKKDNDILRTCLAFKDTGKQVALVTKDIFLGIKADDLGIQNEDFRKDAVADIDDQYTGKIHLYLNDEDFRLYVADGYMEVENFFIPTYTDTEYKESHDFVVYPNEFVIIHNAMNSNSTLLGRVSRSKRCVKKLKYENEHPYGVTPRNASQRFMQEALMDSVSDTPLVVIKGPAGTAKTFYSLAVGLERVYEGNNNEGECFRKILICRPNQLMEDNDLGCLPGTEREKIDPLMRPIYDNLEVLVDSDKESRVSNEKGLQSKINYIFDKQMIDMQAVGFLRGRSIESQWIIIDEAQNLSAKTAKAIITRAGDGTKIILSGDVEQIDAQYLTARTNGLSYIVEKMKDSPLMSVITTDKEDIVRSPLAKEAVKYLKDES